MRDDLVFETTKVVLTGIPIECGASEIKPYLPNSDKIENIVILDPKRDHYTSIGWINYINFEEAFTALGWGYFKIWSNDSAKYFYVNIDISFGRVAIADIHNSVAPESFFGDFNFNSLPRYVKSEDYKRMVSVLKRVFLLFWT